MAALNPFPILRTCALRPRTAVLRPSNAVIGVKRPACRSFADKLPKAEQGEVGPNMQQADHVSEEAAKMSKIQGGEGPDIEGQGTPVQDILRDEKEIRKQAPEIMQKDTKKGDTTKPSTSRSFSTLARRRNELSSAAGPESAVPLDPSMLPTAEQQSQFAAELATSDTTPSHKFPLPTLPLPREMVKDLRYDPVVNQITNLMMVDGKKAQAQRYMATILNILRTSPSPTYNPARPLLPGAPPASYLPLNPTLYLSLAIDSVAPLLRIRNVRGAAGGGQALQVPVPLNARQRRRAAFTWILDQAKKRRSRGSGKDMFPSKVAEELIAVVEGRSTVWERRVAVHKAGTTARMNVVRKKWRKH